MLILSRKTNQKIRINDDIEITIIDVRGDQVKIGITAPRSVKVFREEVYIGIQRENEAASKSTVPKSLPALPFR